MHELGAKFDRNRQPRIAQSVNAAAQPLARFQYRHADAGMSEPPRGGEAGRTGADNEDGLHDNIPLRT